MQARNMEGPRVQSQGKGAMALTKSIKETTGKEEMGKIPKLSVTPEYVPNVETYTGQKR